MQSNLGDKKKKTFGLALSGSGNRSSFYIGFLEVLDEQGLRPDYISVCSGGSLVAAAYACGSLPEFKERVLNLDTAQIKQLVLKGNGGGYYSLDLVEEEIRKYTKGLRFEDVRPLMSFSCVDVETGEKVLMQMGDIARAARISCTLPGIFEPVVWGGRTLVDGGLLTIVPTESLKQANVDVVVGVTLRGTKHIFTSKQLTVKKMYNLMKKIFFVEEINEMLDWIISLIPETEEEEKRPRTFSVLGKSLDIALAAQKLDLQEPPCDMLIQPKLGKYKRSEFSSQTIRRFYELGRQTASENSGKIKELLEQ
ncbi:MAG: patatin-like phospholipase family protein [Patescibacteria group bacterium]|nr:patatin-like phospholipase family protein [Patescibacteria group bacterium]